MHRHHSQFTVHNSQFVIMLLLLGVLIMAVPAYAALLVFVEVQRDGIGGVDGLNGARSVTLSPDDRFLYVAGLFDDAVAVFRRDATTGRLAFVAVNRDGTNGIDGLDGASSVAVSPDGRHLYATSGSTFFENREDNAVAAFRRNAVTGQLSFVQVIKNGVQGMSGLNGASSVAISPDGRHAYVTAPRDNRLSVFTRDAGTGMLTFAENYSTVRGACWVALSPDGRHAYVVGFAESAVAVFRRDGVTGALTLVETQRDGVAGVDGLFAASWVAVSPDGKHVYVTGAEDDAVAVFGRNTVTGRLAFVEAQKDGVAGVDGLEGAHAAAVSPDGRYVYVTGAYEGALVLFSRDPETGRLTFIELHRDGVGGVDGLEGGRSIAVSQDGRFVYVAGFFDLGVPVFELASGGPVVGTATPTVSPSRTPAPALGVRPVGGYAEPLTIARGGSAWIIIGLVAAAGISAGAVLWRRKVHWIHR